MKDFTVIKQLYSNYAVQVQAEDATDAVIKARANEHGDGDLVDDGTQNETSWEVYEGEVAYPIDSSKRLPTNAGLIRQDMWPETVNSTDENRIVKVELELQPDGSWAIVVTKEFATKYGGGTQEFHETAGRNVHYGLDKAREMVTMHPGQRTK